MSIGCANPRTVQVGILPEDLLAIKHKDQGSVPIFLSKPRNGQPDDA